MKKIKTILTYFLVTLVVVIIAFAITASRQPDTFRVERSITMSAPAARPFTLVNDFHNWKAWSPYEGLDPNMTTTYTGPDSGIGAKMAWSGNRKAGQGSMTITESRPTEFIRADLEFTEPFAASNTAEFTFKPEGNQTLVTWAMTGKNPFMFKVLHAFINMDKLVGGDFERGLAKMKTVAEAK